MDINIPTLCIFPIGSNYICNPPVTNTDIDYMCLVQNLTIAHSYLILDDWVPSAERDYPDTNWFSYRKGKDNIIVTDNIKYYLKMYYATETAKLLNLQDKADRIALFNQILGKV